MNEAEFTLLVQPIAFPSMDDLLWLADRLEEAYENARVLISTEQLAPDMRWYDWSRRQYLSPMVLGRLKELKSELDVDVVLGVADIDAYVQGLNFVFGEAVLGGGIAVVYTRRLRQSFYGEPEDHELFRERLLKEALHELGHALGLQHCGFKGCVMNFSNSILEVDAKKPAYCPACVKTLEAHGVKVGTKYRL